MRLRIGHVIAAPAILAALSYGGAAGAAGDSLAKNTPEASKNAPEASSQAPDSARAPDEIGATSQGAAQSTPSESSNAGTSAGPSSSGPAGLTSSAKAAAGNSPEADHSASTSFALQQLGLAQKRPWQIGATFETHRLLRQDDLGGAARSKALNYLNLYAGIRPTPKDQIRVSGGIYQRFLADGGETGIRADDLEVSYNHMFALPWNLMLRPAVGSTIPVSFESRLMGLYAAPSASLLLMRNFLDGNLNVMIRGGGAAYITEYKQGSGAGSANPIASSSLGIGVNYSMPFHQNLQVGASAQTGWQFLHEVEHGNDPNLEAQFRNAPIQPTQDPQFESQPVQQNYGGEVYVGYQLPSLLNTQSNIQLALSQGNNAVIHDGVRNVYWMFRRSAQVYLALQVQY